MIRPAHPLTIGDLHLWVIADAIKDMDEARVRNIMPSISAEALALFHAETHPHLFCFNTLCIRHGDKILLVDTGAGERGNAEEGHLPSTLAALGIAPEAVTAVLLTHAHGDHYSGLLTASGDPTFPNAALYIGRDEWAYWMESGQAPAERVALLQAALAPYATRTHVFAVDASLPLGLAAVALPGHTPGHAGLMIGTGGQRLLHLADTLHMTLQFALPHLSPRFDVQPDRAIETRRAIFGQAADEHLLTLGYHLPFPGLGSVHREGDGFGWTPHLSHAEEQIHA